MPERGSRLGIRALLKLARWLGRGPARACLSLVALYYFCFHASARKASREYLVRLQGKATAWDIYQHIWCFAQVTLDRLLIAAGALGHFSFTRAGSEHLREQRRKDSGAILLGAHVGSFEALCLHGGKEDLRVAVLGHFANASKINDALEALNPAARARVILIGENGLETMLRAKAHVEGGGLLGILGDRVWNSERSATVRFLGGRVRLPTGPYLLAASLGCPIYLSFGLYCPPNHYQLYCEPFAERVELPRREREAALQAYAERYAARLEHFVRLAPNNWFNFFDFWVEE